MTKTHLDLPKDDRGYTLDINGRPIHLDNNPNLLRVNAKLPLTHEHIEEIYRCSTDIFYFIENHVKIFTLDNGWTSPSLRSYQRDMIQCYIDNRFINVKSGRQSGKSVSTMLYILWKILFEPDTIVGIAANKASMAVENLSRLKDYYEFLPMWLKVGVKKWNDQSIVLENGSKVYTSATSKSSFRGLGLSILFSDEAAFVPTNIWNDFSSSVIPTVSSGAKSQIINTSTPKGLNHFFEMWQLADLGKSKFVNFAVEWWEVPGRDDSWKEDMIKTLRGGEVEFNQEYACEFLGSSDTLISIPSIQIQAISEPIRENQFIHGFKEYQEKEEAHNYIISVDPSKDGKDGFSIQVTDITAFPFKQTASADLQVNYLKMPGILYDMGIYYNNAYIIVENNEGAGQSIVDKLLDVYEYDHLYKDKKKAFYGFRTTTKKRTQILSHLKIFLENGKLKLYDKKTIDQLYTFINKNGKYQADSGAHDDLVMALAILFAPFLDNNSYQDYDAFIKSLDIEDSEEIEDIMGTLSIGFFDDGTDVSNNDYGSYHEESYDF